jgi:hypothetical protein
MGAVRRGGRTYAGRTILFVDCRRDVEVVLGQDLIDQLAPPLSLLLTMVRWYTHQATTRLLGYFRGVYEKLRADGGSDRVPFPTFWKVAEGETLGGNLVAEVAPSSVVRGVVDEFQARLMEVLALSADPRRVQHRAAELAPKVRATFAAPHSGGLPMRFHSPDILIAADGSEAIARGDYQFVVGETHAGTHTFCTPLFLELCPDAAELLRDRATDLPGFEVFPIMSRDRYLRVNPSSYGRDFHVETGDARSWLPRDRVFAAADLVVESIGDQPFVRRSGDPRAFDLVTFLDYYMVRVLVSECRWVAPLPHTPRVTIDRLVIVREAWRFEAPELPFAHGDHGFPRFVEARRWAAKHAMPRFVFVKVPEERKPVYVDFESALCVEQLAHLFRGASSAQVTEMLPAVGQSWLTDAEGNRYVSELRMAAVDPAYPAQRVLGVE